MKDALTHGGALSRRAFVQTIGAGGLFLAAPQLWLQADTAGAPDPEQIHLQFGADASRQVTVSWATPVAVRRPRVHLGLRKGRINVKIWDTAPSATGVPTVFEEFTLERPRRDGERERSGAVSEAARRV